MRKIPTLFLRDENDRSRVTDEVNPECLWVFRDRDNCVATVKHDGACCMVRGGILYKRREVRPDKRDPEGFELVQEDANTGKRVGWVRVGDGPEDKWFREAHDNRDGFTVEDGTYELVGPKVQGNPEGLKEHMLVRHGCAVLNVPPEKLPLFNWLRDHLCEGVVWHHADGRRAKIKRRDFGLPWPLRELVEG